MSEVEFPKGIMYKAPRAGAPDFVKGQISIKIDELIPYLNEKVVNGNWLNLDIKTSKQGKDYIAVNTWKKEQSGGTNNQQSASNAGSENMNNKDWETQGFSQVDPDQPF